jgi:hypothetical protein
LPCRFSLPLKSRQRHVCLFIAILNTDMPRRSFSVLQEIEQRHFSKKLHAFSLHNIISFPSCYASSFLSLHRADSFHILY